MRANLLGPTLGLALAACGAPAPGVASDLRGALDTWEAPGRGRVASVTVARGRAPEPPRRTVRVRRPAAARFAGEGPAVDVRFERAPLAEALWLLADAADVGLVVGEGVDAPVTADLRRVRPLAAMRALAEAHGVELARRGRIVIARRRSDAGD
ncbi:MAG TPA: hypothetical protein RMH99_17585 [Sandaracinaceae bacterium LLY-WYZ-13_1]|nr:hypothetical protein [Sandaracinaceae bacterium LLY-WYZ-13_1]